MPIAPSISSVSPSTANGSRSAVGSDLGDGRSRRSASPTSRQQDAELVAAEAGHGVAGRAARVAAAADLLEQHVAVVVAERVVDLLEVVEVHEHHGGRVSRRAAARSACCDAVAEQHAVRQAGERVVERLVLLGDRLAPAAVDGQQRQDEQRQHGEREVGGDHQHRREAEQQAGGRGLEEESEAR